MMISAPLRLISRALRSEDPSCIEKLARGKGEFAEIAAMVKDFFAQRSQLMREVEERKVSEEKFSKAFNFSPILMAITNFDDGCFIDMNDMFLKVTGYKRNELLGQTSTGVGIVSLQDRTIFKDIAEGRLKDREAEIKIKTKFGRERTCLFSADIITLKGKKAILAAANDITDMEQAEEDLKKKMEDLEKFNKLAVGRELKMIELKEKIAELEAKLKAKG
jgi:PAS domain S-box-containing protein